VEEKIDLRFYEILLAETAKVNVRAHNRKGVKKQGEFP
jgi:hypothetical protein